jgi:hypothetical protein
MSSEQVKVKGGPGGSTGKFGLEFDEVKIPDASSVLEAAEAAEKARIAEAKKAKEKPKAVHDCCFALVRPR